MKKILLSIIVIICIIAYSCKKDEDDSDRSDLLTSTVWVSDSLLVNGIDASGPSGFLEDFVGEATFNKDGTGMFGIFSGTWRLAFNETQLILNSDSLDFPLTANIAELTSTSLKITTGIPGPIPLNVRMTFKAK